MRLWISALFLFKGRRRTHRRHAARLLFAADRNKTLIEDAVIDNRRQFRRKDIFSYVLLIENGGEACTRGQKDKDKSRDDGKKAGAANEPEIRQTIPGHG